MKNLPKNTHEKYYFQESTTVCGIDEVGRGCLAGPVVTAAAVLFTHRKNSLIKDSKLLDADQLEKAYSWLVKNSIFSTSIVDHRVVDKLNIDRATQVSMQRAYHQLAAILPQQPAVALVDAMPLTLPCKVVSLVKGETESISIAAASIIAKVTRDRIMRRLAQTFPMYHLAAHKGYATAAHYQALESHGHSIIHRMTFLEKFNQQHAETARQQELFSL